ncbi:PSD1 and planctomycete cytochrome C domain-containing protein [Tautonia plasticadhaerens]|uniref:Planctomycete cytochrome C n=1 Tax=Tautonia plasticadhaerens TaxID=2527974 RepID=A0A518H356_9BACT|nr:PSD1 and planctomycete cytochrome C domain-containing protein [Tautonia plasticadhaerens]QDV35279.1 Planctomycete cytochrome C [Tautonia plasticadhaerens]
MDRPFLPHDPTRPHRTRPPLPLGLLLAVPLLAAAGGAEAGEAVDYASQVKPILEARCFACHGALKQQAGLRLDTVSLMLEGGDSGPAIEPGEAEFSPLVERVAAEDAVLRMPPEGEPLGEEQIALIRSWIDQGADGPADEAPEPDPDEHWSFRPPTRPPVPDAGAGWARGPIDAFLAAGLERAGLDRVGEAPPHVLLRRVYLDLIGLPPPREELNAFLADPSDEAYEREVDRLLADPRHGERWARHWMDVWRYSDWYGRRAVPDVLNSYAMIWRWRDWIVRELNDDSGYDHMVRMMLAADELAPGDPEELPATGFVVRNFYRWNYNSWLADSVEHTGKAFLGLTINCAHCHDHKYDPIRHEDYFALRAVFEPIELRHDRVPGEPDPGPYPTYEYGKAYKPITSGMVRVFDKTLDAETFLYTRGQARNVVPGRPPIPPGPPRFLAGEDFRVEPIGLPAEASYPGLKDFIRREETEAREQALADARAALDMTMERLDAIGPDAAESEREAARLAERADRLAVAAAEAEREALRLRIAADDARHSRCDADPDEAARLASGAERAAAAAQARTGVARAERAEHDAKIQGDADAIAKAGQQVAAARQELEAAEGAIDADSAEYAPLSPSFPGRSTGRRAALAEWITRRDNPLAARVAVNHLWGWHFGEPIVATPHDLGRNGAEPTHPGLLDWLAVELMEPSTPGVRPWSMKHLHRQIVLSASYRMASQASDPDHPGRSLDPEDRMLWRFRPARMEAEVVRDSLLHVAGVLDPEVGGPELDQSEGQTNRRRSLYFAHHGEASMPFLELFDAPDPGECYRRTTSVVPQQSLALANSGLALAMARTIAPDLSARLADPGDDAFIVAAFERVLSRPPSPEEHALSASFLDRQARLFSGEELPEAPGIDPPPSTDPGARARENLIHALLNHNDFVTIR